MKMTKNQIINKVIKNYNNTWLEFSGQRDELKNSIYNFKDIENVFDSDKFDEFCKNIVEHPIYDYGFSPLKLFYGYMFKYHMNNTIENWPDFHDTLVDALHYWNYSTDILY